MTIRLSASVAHSLIALVLWLPVLHAADSAQVDKRPNILLIFADDLGYSDIAPYGGEIETPNLQQLADSGRRLTNFHVAPTCSPTRASLISGVDHHRSGLGSMAELLTDNQKGKPGYEGYLNDRVVAFPELLRDAGYHTLIAGKWHLGREASYRPQARGFSQSYTLLGGASSHYLPVNPPPAVAWFENDQQVTPPADFYATDFYTSKLIEFLDRTKGDGKPFFAFAAYTAPHWPLQASPELIAKYRGRFDAGYDVIRTRRLERLRSLGIIRSEHTPNPGLPSTKELPRWEELTAEQRQLETRRMEIYAAMVDNLDHNIGRLIAHLKSTGQYDNTVVFFASDNGSEGHVAVRYRTPTTDNRLENLGRPGSFVAYGQRWAEVSAAPFRLSKGFATEGGIISPAIIRFPPSLQAKPLPGHADRFASVLDLAPTILDLAQVAHPGTSYRGRTVEPLDGTSLLPYLRGEQASPHPADHLYGEELFGQRTIRQGDWKLVWITPPTGPGRWELFDLANDPGEVVDLAAKQPERVAALTAAWGQYAERNHLVLPEGLNAYLAPLTIGQ